MQRCTIPSLQHQDSGVCLIQRGWVDGWMESYMQHGEFMSSLPAVVHLRYPPDVTLQRADLEGAGAQDVAPSYLSGFVKLLLQPRYRHGCYTAAPAGAVNCCCGCIKAKESVSGEDFAAVVHSCLLCS